MTDLRVLARSLGDAAGHVLAQQMENDDLRAENARLRTVFDAAVAWEASLLKGEEGERQALYRLEEAVAAALDGTTETAPCATCRGTGLVPPLGLPSNGPDPCPECGPLRVGQDVDGDTEADQ